MRPRFVILMGVAGCGKTSVGRALAQKLNWNFYDADDFHPPENISKMANGHPLNDLDRAPWLAALRDLIANCLGADHPGVLACSALKESYRLKLMQDNPDVLLVYLKGEYDLIAARVASREAHYMRPAMLRSQFDALEEPLNAYTLNVSLKVEEITERIMTKIDQQNVI